MAVKSSFVSDCLPIEQILVYGNLPSSLFYKSPVWRKARYNALATHGNRCQLCGNGPQTGTVVHVDHIKPRSLYPESCLDPSNLQILCEDCHSAKGTEWIDDFRAKLSQKSAVELRDLIRINRNCLIVEHRPPHNRREVDVLGASVCTPVKNYRKRWRLFLDFCFRTRKVYSEAAFLTVAEFLECKRSNGHQYEKFLFAKNPTDLVFDIGGAHFPREIRRLLADGQEGV